MPSFLRSRAVRAAGVVIAVCAGGVIPRARAQKTQDIRLNTGVPPGTDDGYAPRIAVSGSDVYSVWFEMRNHFNLPDVYFNRSDDSGGTWLASDVRLNTNAPGVSSSRNVQVAASGSAVFVVWMDDRNGSDDLYFNRSLDGGATWLSADVRLDHDAPGGARSVAPRILSSGANVFVVWQDDRNGNFDIYFNRSLDSGATWLPGDVRLDTGDPMGDADSKAPVIALAGGDLCVAWFDARNGSMDIYFNRSTNLGLTWLAVDTRLDSGDAPGASDSLSPQIATSGSTVIVVWEDWRSGSADVFDNVSPDAGVTWSASDLRIDHGPAGTRAKEPVVGAVGSTVAVAWKDNRQGFGSWEIFANPSPDGGLTWAGSDTLLSPTTTANDSPDILVSSALDFAVVWTGDSASCRGVFLNRTFDGGATWLAMPRRVSSACSPPTAWAPHLAAGLGAALVTWEDTRNGKNEPFFNLALGMQPYGAGTAGSGGFVPLLGGSGMAFPGNTLTLSVSNGLGAAAGALFVGSGQGSVPVLGGTLLVWPLAVGNPPLVPLGGTPGTPGGGTALLPLSIPSNPGLIGFLFTFQLLIVDPGGPAGVSMTNGLAVWMG